MSEDERTRALLELIQMDEAPLDELLDFALETAVRLTHSRIGYLYQYQEEPFRLEVHAWSAGVRRLCAMGEAAPICHLDDTLPWGEALRSGQPVMDNDYAAPNPFKKGLPAGHVELSRHLHVPVFVADRIVALVGVGNKESDYDELDTRHLVLLMDAVWRIRRRREAMEELRKLNQELEQRVATRTIELRQANERLHKMAIEDALTGLANRRHFNETLDAEIRRCRRSGEWLTLIMCDVDFFKRYNDRYGHLAGDWCLQQVAAAMHGQFRRAGDLAARYGGEEFAVILPATPPADGMQLAEQLRRTVAELALPHEKSEAAAVVTLSIGVCSVRPDESRTAASLVNLADEALYRSKKAGRNRVEEAVVSAATS
jgi:diguanylate cyclase (GGDEF)-like protein